MSENQTANTAEQNATEEAGQPQEQAPELTLEQAQARIAELEKAAEKYKALMRKEEAAKKAHWQELQELKKAQLSETERAILEAEERGRQAALAEFENERRQMKLAAAAAKAGVPEEVLRIIDPAKVFDEAGEVDMDLLTALSGASKPKFQKTATDLGIGAKSNGNAGQITREQLKQMSYAEINKARREGRLDALMRGQI